MLDRRRLSRHACDFSLLLFWLYLAFSLLGYDVADPPGSSVEPPNEPVRNPCGPIGASLASAAFHAMGFSSLFLLVALACVILSVWLRRRLTELLPQGLGILLVAASLAGLIQRWRPTLSPSPVVGSGGYVGGALSTLLGDQFGPLGSLLIMIAIGGLGLILCSDWLSCWSMGQIQEWTGRQWTSISRRLGWRQPDVEHVAEETTMLGLPAPELIPRSIATGLPAVINKHSPTVPVRMPEGFPVESSRAGGGAWPPAVGPSVVAARSNGQPQGLSTSLSDYVSPSLELLEPPPAVPITENEHKIQARALLLERTLLDFGYKVRVVQIDTGPVITQFEIELEAGLRVSRIMSLSNDLAIALAVPSVRIVAPIPGKTTVGIEVPNDRRGFVKLGEVMHLVSARIGAMRIPMFIGRDVKGTPLVFDLAEMPHLLIAGRTGTGKSVCLNSMILSILMTKRPDEVKLLLIDPKFVELSQFKRVPHLMHPVVTDMKKAESILAWACEKMDERYGFLARAGVRNIQSYNQLGADEIYERLRPEDEEDRKRIPTYMPYIVIVADEMADLMMTAAKEVESHIVRLAQKARAVGMHLIAATQKPTVDVITGLIKGNLPARIGFQVTSRNDSSVVLDQAGAEKLLGNGDMLFLVPGTSHLIRAQGTYVSDAEIHRICEYLQRYPVEFSRELVQLQVTGAPGGKDRASALKERDEHYESAIEIVIREGRGSCSLLQRALGIGYGRAARLIDFMAEDGIVGEYKSGAAREVLVSLEQWEELKNAQMSQSER